MTPGLIRAAVVLEKSAWVKTMLDEIRRLPLSSREEFSFDRRNSLAAESCIRRALEGLLDLARHVLARGFGRGIIEYKEIAEQLRDVGVIGAREAKLLREMAGYRNRLTHFYDEISQDELFEICARRLGNIESVLDVVLDWLRRHPDHLDAAL